MLNEFIEFESYLSEDTRLSFGVLSDNKRKQTISNSPKRTIYKLNGLEQILTVIARGFIFSEFLDNKKKTMKLESQDVIEVTKEILKLWCGFDYDSKDDGCEIIPQRVDLYQLIIQEWLENCPKTTDWLRKFWTNKYIQSYKKRTVSEKEADQHWKEMSRYKYEKLIGGDYLANTFSFNNVIANAMELGPLKKRYCAIKKNEDNRIFDIVINTKGQKKELTKPTTVKMLKHIIAFRILQEEHPGNPDEVWLKKLRVYSWSGIENSTEKLNHNDAKWNDQLCIYQVTGNGFVKYGINKAFLEQFEFKLINEDEISDYIDAYWIVEDLGHGTKSIKY